MGYLRSVHGVTSGRKIRSCEIWKSPNVDFGNHRMSSHFSPEYGYLHSVSEKIGEALLSGYNHKKAAQTSTKDKVT